VRYHAVLTILGLALAAILLIGPGLAGAQRIDSQPTDPSGDSPATLLPHDLEAQQQLESRWERGLSEEEALEIMRQEQAIEASIREHQESAPDAEAQIGYPHSAPQGGSRTASLRGPVPSQDVKELEALVRRGLVPGLKALGASEADIEMMVQDITQILAGATPGR
jgi:hypothetical protein